MVPRMLIFAVLLFILLQRTVKSTVLEFSKSYFFVKIIFSKGHLWYISYLILTKTNFIFEAYDFDSKTEDYWIAAK